MPASRYNLDLPSLNHVMSSYSLPDPKATITFSELGRELHHNSSGLQTNLSPVVFTVVFENNLYDIAIFECNPQLMPRSTAFRIDDDASVRCDSIHDTLLIYTRI